MWVIFSKKWHFNKLKLTALFIRTKEAGKTKWSYFLDKLQANIACGAYLGIVNEWMWTEMNKVALSVVWGFRAFGVGVLYVESTGVSGNLQ